MLTPRSPSLPPSGPFLVFALLAALATPALAQDDISVSVSSTVKAGEAPAVTLTIRKPLERAVLDLKASGPGAPKGRVKVSGGPSKAGSELVLSLPKQLKPGTVRWSGTLSVTFQDGAAGSMPLAFETRSATPPSINLAEGGLDLAHHSITVVMDRPAKAVDLEILGDDGQLIANTSQAFSGEPAGTPLTLTWVPKTDAAVMRLRLVAHDTAGFYSPARDLHPWSLELPHEEIVFDTNEATLRESEEPKLSAVLPELNKRLTRYRGIIDVKLYIMGHTDTVGPASRNQVLSAQRAKTIARWFKARGVRAPIFAKGLGEDYPEVPTPDETDEIRNRRVDYVLAVENPLRGPWERVQ
jgi:outer membrane protein OmpA-like peptidoglycan-associated protein